MTEAREQILARIAAKGSASHGRPPAHDYRRSGALDPEERVELFCRRTGDYQAEVLRITDDEIGTTVAAVCNTRNVATLVVPFGIPAAWRGTEIELIDDNDLTASQLDQIAGALTGCTAAIAETGTIVLTAGATEGRRALTLVPDLHICVVLERQIVEILPEALTKLADQNLEQRPLTLISGPSATSDIELSRVEGVHGPRDLVVLVVAAATNIEL